MAFLTAHHAMINCSPFNTQLAQLDEVFRGNVLAQPASRLRDIDVADLSQLSKHGKLRHWRTVPLSAESKFRHGLLRSLFGADADLNPSVSPLRHKKRCASQKCSRITFTNSSAMRQPSWIVARPFSWRSTFALWSHCVLACAGLTILAK